MAKGLYQKWLEDDNLVLLQGWKRNGLTDEQIAHNMSISVHTLNHWKQKYKQIRQSLKVGRETANFIVERELFQKAINGNTTAMIFWLKNNWRDKYNDSQLSPDELKLAKARSRKTNAEANIAEFKAQMLKESGSSGVELLNEYLDKLDSLAEKEVKEDGPKTDV
ncbi:MAG: Putative bacteriophage terminase small subunit [Bacteriophage sp.]|uniref:small terminase subunit n=1 Tax=Ligilactobacillus salivarius TaxID=1624 RepID=UPI00136F6F8B|nr:small terminase subunit [Ligilactobacillus salivarius]MYU70419.1 small terminase subunit [Ligilactobacillus salivarius]MYZ74930.1 small terminase subunit [Ligilactobacillus salivarius]UVY23116.1 MAG: Putative bacteriophage terminase small subunit [Bacteriophage sp.]DAY67696.1 MAG TPA: terminase small subunit [Caudoviricetes sp.]